MKLIGCEREKEGLQVVLLGFLSTSHEIQTITIMNLNYYKFIFSAMDDIFSIRTSLDFLYIK
jgi:hypothetical protein